MKNKQTYNQACLGYLLYEFHDDEIAETDAKIKRKLYRYKLGKFDPKRIGVLRALKNDLMAEISKYNKSHYYLGLHGKYSSFEDFDFDAMYRDYSAKYPKLSKKDLTWFINFSLFTYYLR
jgi:hypothetical protein